MSQPMLRSESLAAVGPEGPAEKGTEGIGDSTERKRAGDGAQAEQQGGKAKLRRLRTQDTCHARERGAD
eukprot:2006197-Alexandrium_andersonii.AAC.1